MLPAIALLLVAATLLYISSPWWFAGSAPSESDAVRQSDQQDALLLELKELEFDHRMGKIDGAEYAAMRAATAAAASALMDHQAGSLQRRRQLEAEAEVLVARARLQRQERRVQQQWSCPQCSRVVPGTDQFCGSCGAARPPMAEPAMAQPAMAQLASASVRPVS